MNILRIYFSGEWKDGSSQCSWAICNELGELIRSGTDALSALPDCKECVAIVAPDRVLCLVAKAPPGSRRRWKSILPYWVEEYTLPEPDANHIVPGPTLGDGQMIFAVIDKSWLGRIVDACRAANLNLRKVIPETFLPAVAPDSWTLVWDGGGGFLRTGLATGLALDDGDASAAPAALKMLLATNKPMGAEQAKIEMRFPFYVPEASQVLPRWPELPVKLVHGAAWDWRRADIPADALNLLWGAFEPRIRVGDWWPRLRPAMFILLAALGVEAVGANMEWLKLSHEKNLLVKDMERSFHAAFGDAGLLVNAPVQMRRKLAELRHSVGRPDEGDFLSLLDTASPALSGLPEGSVRGLHYEPGRLEVDLRLADSSAVMALGTRLKNLALGVQMGEIHNLGDGAECRITLLPGGEL